MRIVESFSNWLAGHSLNENISAAKIYMQKRYAKRLRKDPNALTPEERDKALTEPAYLQILEIVKAYPGYAMPFIKFHFDHGATIQDLTQLLEIVKTKKYLIQQLTMPIEQWSNIEPVNGIKGFEQLMDEIRTMERAKDAKWFMEALPKPLRDQYRLLDGERKKEAITLAIQLKELGESAIGRLFAKIKAMSSWTIEQVLEYTANYVKGFANLGLSKKVKELEELEPEAGVIYSDEQYLVMSMRTENAQKKLCSVANWCINRGSFSSYASDAVQLNIFNFGTDPSDPLFLTGTTVYYNGKVRTSHDINDRHIMKSSDPTEHLTQLGYPQALVSNVVQELATEMMVKKVVYDLKLDKTKPVELLFNIIKQSYLVDPAANQDSLNIVLHIVDTRIKENLTQDQVLKMYKDQGVLSKFSAQLVKMLLADASAQDIQAIIDATLSIFAEVNLIAKEDPSLVFPQVRNILAQENDVLRELGLNRGDVDAVMESIEPEDFDHIVEYWAAEPAVAPTTKPAPTKPATRPSTPSRPSPIPTKQPFKQPEPAKAEADDVIKRLKMLTNEEL
jgi:hypothetical protein